MTVGNVENARKEWLVVGVRVAKPSDRCAKVINSPVVFGDCCTVGGGQLLESEHPRPALTLEVSRARGKEAVGRRGKSGEAKGDRF